MPRRLPLEHGAAKADVDRLVLRVVGESLLAELAADTALLVATEGQLVRKQVVACSAYRVSMNSIRTNGGRCI